MTPIQIEVHACTGCGDCVQACVKQLGERPSPEPGPSRVQVLGPGPLFWLSLCRQCAEAPCADACISGALSPNRASGRIDLNESVCIGCGMCVMVCPFAAIQRDARKGKAVKCDACPTLPVPACVSACRAGALRVGPTGEMASRQRRATTRAKWIGMAEERPR